MDLLLSAAETLLTASQAFMAACGLNYLDADDVAQAKAERIHADYFDDEDLIPAMTHAVVTDGDQEYDTVGGGAKTHVQAGDRAVVLCLCQPARPGEHKASKRAFLQFVDDVVAEIADNCGADGYYPFVAIEKLHPASRVPRMERTGQVDFWYVRYQLVGRAAA